MISTAISYVNSRVVEYVFFIFFYWERKELQALILFSPKFRQIDHSIIITIDIQRVSAERGVFGRSQYYACAVAKRPRGQHVLTRTTARRSVVNDISDLHERPINYNKILTYLARKSFSRFMYTRDFYPCTHVNFKVPENALQVLGNALCAFEVIILIFKFMDSNNGHTENEMTIVT